MADDADHKHQDNVTCVDAYVDRNWINDKVDWVKKKLTDTSSWFLFLRWNFIAFCFVVLGFSITLVVYSSIGYSQVRTAFDELQTQHRFDLKSEEDFMRRFRPELALAIFYVGIGLGIVMGLIAFMGFLGGVFEDGCFLTIYAISMAAILLGSIIGVIVAWNVHYQEMEDLAIKVYKEYVQHLYGKPQRVIVLFAMIIDSIQRNHRCCGILDTKDNDTKTKYGVSSTEYTVLFWLESTQWGQVQLESIQYTEGRSVLWIPISCCRQPEKNCSNGIYGEHFDWTDSKEKYWKEKIYTEGCQKYVFDFRHLDETGKEKAIALGVVAAIVFGVTIIQAIILAMY